LPRLLAFADDRIAALDDLGIRAAAIAAAGPGVGLVARMPDGTTDQLAKLAQRFVALAAPPMATVFVTGRIDVALAVNAHGVILRNGDLGVGEVCAVAGRWGLGAGGSTAGESAVIDKAPSARRRAPSAFFVLRSVHTVTEAETAVREGVDAIIVGAIWPSASHPERPAVGMELLERVVAFGVPVFAIGGVTPERAVEAREAGAWGVASISAVWDAAEPYRAAIEIVARVTNRIE